MAKENFTHLFEVDFSADGSQYIHGQVEFNGDGKVSYKIEESSTPLSKEALIQFSKLIDNLHESFHIFGGIKKVEIKQK